MDIASDIIKLKQYFEGEVTLSKDELSHMKFNLEADISVFPDPGYWKTSGYNSRDEWYNDNEKFLERYEALIVERQKLFKQIEERDGEIEAIPY